MVRSMLYILSHVHDIILDSSGGTTLSGYPDPLGGGEGEQRGREDAARPGAGEEGEDGEDAVKEDGGSK